MKSKFICLLVMLSLLIFTSCLGSIEKKLEKDRDDALVNLCKVQMKNIDTALQMYQGDHNEYPTDLKLLTEPYEIQGKEQRPYMKQLPESILGGEYKIMFPEDVDEAFVLYCSGEKKENFSYIPENFPQYSPLRGFRPDPSVEKEIVEERELSEEDIKRQKVELDQLMPLYEFAETSYNEGDYHVAIEHCDRLLDMLIRYQQIKEGRDFLEKCKELKEKCNKTVEALPDPSSAEEWLKRGYSLHKQGVYEEAIEALDKSLELEPDSIEALYYKGASLRDLDRHDEAIQYFDKVIEIDPEYHWAWANKASLLSDQGKYEEALTYYEKTVELVPDSKKAWNNNGSALDDLERYEEAIVCYDKALEIDPYYKKAKENRAKSIEAMEK